MPRRDGRASIGINAALPPYVILCGSDLSQQSWAIVRAAAGVAHKREQELALVHVLPANEAALRLTAEQSLAAQVERARGELAIQVTGKVVVGNIDEQLLAVAHERGARLIVVGATGDEMGRRHLGGVSESLCRGADVAVLVVRRPDQLLAWAKNHGPLRALVGTGLGDASKSALAYIGNWPDVASTVVHVAWPYGEHYRLGIAPNSASDELSPEVETQLLGDLARWALEVPWRSSPSLRVVAGWGRVDAHLAHLALDDGTNLVVLGIHQRNAQPGIWQASLSRSILHETSCNVLCVPERFFPVRAASSPKLVVVPTDFSPLSDRAIAVGASLLALGGTLHLVHVTTAPRHAWPALVAELTARLPKDGKARGIVSEARVLEGSVPWLAIWQHAERARAHSVCMATHSSEGRSGVELGTQTKTLLQHSKLPVMLVPPDRES
jgi:nucleotide-binding universal stress UspA family protein